MGPTKYTAKALRRWEKSPPGETLLHELSERVTMDPDLGEVVRRRHIGPMHRAKDISQGVSSDSMESVPVKHASARQFDGTELDWKYRGRSNSESVHGQPITAPTEHATQKDEGFQKFYKAVASPTHVRVTAGGRIVPNTRGSSSPTSRWGKDRLGSDPARAPSGEPSDASRPGLQSGLGMAPPPLFPAMPQMPPAGLGMPQWMVPQSLPFGPYAMAGMPGMPMMPAYPGYGISQAPGPSMMMPHPMMAQMPPPGFGTMSMCPPGHPLSNHPGAAKPTLTSIRPSEITKRHLETLHSHTRHFEDQLAFNKHQIDEQLVTQQIQELRRNIDHFEEVLEQELAVEKEHQTGQDVLDRVSKSASAKMSEKDERSASTLRVKPSVELAPVRTEPSSASIKSASEVVPTDRQAHKPKVLKKAASLPFTAALAPPFQPRAELPYTADSSVTEDSFGLRGSRLISDSLTTESAEQIPDDILLDDHAAYLVGKVPVGIDPSRVKSEDYVYDRNLTQEEKLAQYLHETGAPRHLFKGLPLFDGKDFYTGIPVKVPSAAVSAASQRAPSEGVTTSRRVPIKIAPEPFRSLSRATGKGRATMRQTTASEALPRTEHKAPRARSPMSHRILRADGSSEDFLTAVGNLTVASTEAAKDKSSSDEGDDDTDIIFKGRRAMSRSGRTRNEVWQSGHAGLKKGMTNAVAVPGTISSTTAQGVLPNYAGHATASLAPTVVNTTAAPRSAHKGDGHAGLGPAAPVSAKKGENRPPQEMAARGNLRHQRR